MQHLFLLLGRLHPLLVHLPVGILVLAFLFEMLSYSRRFSSLRSAVQPTLIVGAIGAVLSCVSGWVLSQEGGYEDSLLDVHLTSGIATAVLSVSLSIILHSESISHHISVPVRLSGFIVMMIFVTIAGHFGGSMTHGEDYLAVFDQSIIDDSGAPKEVVFKTVANTDEMVVYTDVIQPIFEARCYQCHSSKKQKGKLRLDTPDNILKGGESGDLFNAALPDSSLMMIRLHLPLEDEEHMPPSERPQLTSAETDLIRFWIAAGSPFEGKLQQFKNRENIKGTLATIAASSSENEWLPEGEVGDLDEDLLNTLRERRIIGVRVSQETNYVSVNASGAGTLTPQDTMLLKPLHANIVSLNLAGVTIDEATIRLIRSLPNLRQLYLQNSSITDGVLQKLESSISKVVSLNVVGTAVSDKAIQSFVKMKELRKLYCFNTKISAAATGELKAALPDLAIDTGNYSLPVLASDTTVYTQKKK